MKHENILVNQEGNVLTVTVNRPKQLNALNSATIKELHEAFANADADLSIKAIILTGSGEKAFVAGADIKEFANFDSQKGKELSQNGHDLLFDFIENLSTPVIAAINGFALGGGLELAMAAHFRIASENAKVGLPEVTLGLIPGYGGTQRLAKLVGKGKAMEMILTANMISAEDSKKVGLVNYVVTQQELLPLAEKLATKITQNSSIAIGSAIEAINASSRNDINGFNLEINNFGACFDTDDFEEGTSAFLEKRKPKFD